MNFLGRKVCFCFNNPPKRDIVIFDESNSHYITDYILNGIPSFTYKMRPAKIYISFSVIYLFFRSLRIFNWQGIKTRKRKLRAIGKELLCHYHLGFFQFISPKVVITFIDNSSYFHWLCKKYNDAQYFSIQNGNRTNDQLDKRVKQYHQHFFCFGNYEEDRYARFSHVVHLYYPVGSLLGGYYKFNNRNKRSLEKKFDIGIVSQYSKALLENSDGINSVFLKSTNLMHTFLAKYISEYKTKAVVLLRTQGDNNSEIEYFKKFYDDNVEYIFNNRKEFSTYRGMEESEVVLGFFSTASVEAFGWGNKILHCDFTGTDKYNDYDPMIMFTEPNYGAFKRRLNVLRNEPYDEYRKRTKEYASYIMNNDPDCPSHLYIRKRIEEYL